IPGRYFSPEKADLSFWRVISYQLSVFWAIGFITLKKRLIIINFSLLKKRYFLQSPKVRPNRFLKT
ncbi:MAG: hypothetical protein ACLFV6_17745, partial [Spirulinaceae cyanobacterium]